jgi:hypothetical protein
MSLPTAGFPKSEKFTHFCLIYSKYTIFGHGGYPKTLKHCEKSDFEVKNKQKSHYDSEKLKKHAPPKTVIKGFFFV